MQSGCAEAGATGKGGSSFSSEGEGVNGRARENRDVARLRGFSFFSAGLSLDAEVEADVEADFGANVVPVGVRSLAREPGRDDPAILLPAPNFAIPGDGLDESAPLVFRGSTALAMASNVLDMALALALLLEALCDSNSDSLDPRSCDAKPAMEGGGGLPICGGLTISLTMLDCRDFLIMLMRWVLRARSGLKKLGVV